MKRHMKRQSMPKTWPLARKGTTFVVKPLANVSMGVPILVALRDILKITANRQETKRALKEENIMLNGKLAKEDKQSVLIFDVITIIPSKKNYRLVIGEKGKFKFEETKEAEAHKKVAKIIGKKLLKKGQMQINLMGGNNVLSKPDFKGKVNDSVSINLKDSKIDKVLELKNKSKFLVLQGRHAGETLKADKISEDRKIVEVSTEDNKTHNIPTKFIMVLE